jgi:hypothetical protein
LFVHIDLGKHNEYIVVGQLAEVAHIRAVVRQRPEQGVLHHIQRRRQLLLELPKSNHHGLCANVHAHVDDRDDVEPWLLWQSELTIKLQLTFS